MPPLPPGSLATVHREPCRNLIKVEHLTAALAVWDFCDASARYLFGDAQPDPIEVRILTLLETGPKTTTKLHRAMSGHIPAER